MNERCSQFLMGAVVLGLLTGNAAFGDDTKAKAEGAAGAAKTAKDAHHCKTGGHCMEKAKGKTNTPKPADAAPAPAPAPAAADPAMK